MILESVVSHIITLLLTKLSDKFAKRDQRFHDTVNKAIGNSLQALQASDPNLNNNFVKQTLAPLFTEAIFYLLYSDELPTDEATQKAQANLSEKLKTDLPDQKRFLYRNVLKSFIEQFTREMLLHQNLSDALTRLGLAEIKNEFRESENRQEKRADERHQEVISGLGLIESRLGNQQSYSPVFMGDPPPSHFVMRAELYNAIKASLIGEKPSTRAVIGLIGGGGFGKTMLTQRLVKDGDVQERFRDGILWTTLGEIANENTIKDRARTLIKTLKGSDPAGDDWDSLKQALRSAIGSKHLLIVIDDVWNRSYRLVFDGLGDNCIILATTRQEGNLPPNAARHDVDTMLEAESDELLMSGIDETLAGLIPPQPAMTDLQRKELIEFGKRFKGYAQLIDLARAALINGVKKQHNFQAAFNAFKRDYEKLGVVAWDARDPVGRHEAIDIAIIASLREGNGLKPTEAVHVIELSVFKDDSEIPLSTLSRWWGEADDYDAKKFAELFAGLSLVKYNYDRQTLQIHDVVRDVLARKVPDMPALHNRLIAAWGDPRALPDAYAWRTIGYHLIAAGARDRLRDLLLDYGFLQAKLDATDTNALIADCDRLPPDDQAIRLVKSALGMSAGILNSFPDQLPYQLTGRLWTHREKSGIASLWQAAQADGALELVATQQYPPMMQAGGPLLRTLDDHTHSINGAVELTNGHLLSWSNDGTMRLWYPDGTHQSVLERHDARFPKTINAIKLADGRILSWSWNTLYLWGTDGRFQNVLEGHRGSVRGAVKLESGYLISWSADHTLRLWDATGVLCGVLSDTETMSVRGAIELKNRRLLSWSDDGILRLWEVPSFSKGEFLEEMDITPIALLKGHTLSVVSVLVLSNGRSLSWATDNTLRLWDLDSEQSIVLEGHTGSLNGALETADGHLLSWSTDGTLCLWSQSGELLKKLEGHTSEVIGASTLSGKRLISWSSDGTMRLWHPDGTLRHEMKGHQGSINGIRELTNGYFISWSSDSTLRLWDENGTFISALKAHTQAVKNVIQLKDGRLLSWSEDITLRLWSVAILPQPNPKSHKDVTLGVVMLKDGRLLSWSWDKTLRLWDADGISLGVLEGHTQGVKGALEMANKQLLSWSYGSDHTLRVWGPKGHLLTVPDWNVTGTTGWLFLADGRILSWTHDNNTICLWDAEGIPLAVFEGHDYWVNGVIELSNERLLSWSWDGTLRLWHIPPLNLREKDGVIKVIPFATLDDHQDTVEGALVRENGCLLSWSWNSVRLWDPNGAPWAVFSFNLPFNTVITIIKELEDGRLLLWLNDGRLQVWEMQSLPEPDGTWAKVQVLGLPTLDEGQDNRAQQPDNWLDKHKIDPRAVYVNDPQSPASVLAKVINQRLDIYRIGSFYGDAAFGDPIVRDRSIVIGDETGRVIFLRARG